MQRVATRRAFAVSVRWRTSRALLTRWNESLPSLENKRFRPIVLLTGWQSSASPRSVSQKPWRRHHKHAVRPVKVLDGKLITSRDSSSSCRDSKQRRKEKSMAVYFVVDVIIDDPQRCPEHR